ncbi:MAG: STAS/SEC14 domain-containing protein [Nitrospirales bacterium]|nr:STAS/SEC14 domain-containing protein [Nitrospirales bacterium]
MKPADRKNVTGYATVGGPDWRCKAIKTAKSMFKDTDMWTFSEDQERKALAWLGVELAQYAKPRLAYDNHPRLKKGSESCNERIGDRHFR